ncbi:LPS assembly lipoprotein LptE [Rugamonas sp.]|uniref:LPS-assembly lipoprotein LptE n=1 Tax=Rugamonas sp. TaxID=1926287 RepID=UPI0025D81CB9|nr:LPS assembly lipoprotein LptE [Rugamonas sp.]
MPALALTLALTLSACGFHLRGDGGSYTLPFPTIYVGLPKASPLAVDLKRNIRANGATEVVDDPKLADASIIVLTDPDKTRTKTILSLNGNGRVRQYLLIYQILFKVVDQQGNELLAPTALNLNRPIDFDETQLLAKEREEAVLYKDMQTDLVQQMMRRLAAIKPKVAMSLAPDHPVVVPPSAPALKQ